MTRAGPRGGSLVVLLAWITAMAAGWTLGSVWSSTAALPPLSPVAPVQGAPIRSTPERTERALAGPPAIAVPADGAEVDFERLAFDDYDPPALRQASAAMEAAAFPEAARVLDQRRVTLVGFTQAMRVADGSAERVMISRYPPGCCFGTVPVFDEWVLVELNPPVDLVELPTIVRATGTLEVGERMGQGNAVECLYRMTGATLEAY